MMRQKRQWETRQQERAEVDERRKAMEGWIRKLFCEFQRRLISDGEVFISNGQFIDPERVKIEWSEPSVAMPPKSDQPATLFGKKPVIDPDVNPNPDAKWFAHWPPKQE